MSVGYSSLSPEPEPEQQDRKVRIGSNVCLIYCHQSKNVPENIICCMEFEKYQNIYFFPPTFIIFSVCSCLKVLRNSGNSRVFAELYSDVSLPCSYDLEDDILYSIKWYRDDKEFYRYLPKGNNSPSALFTDNDIMLQMLSQ